MHVDYKEGAPESISAAIDGAGVGERVVIYGEPAKLRRILARRPGWEVMPEAENPGHLRELIDGLHLRAAAFDSDDFQPATIEVARKAAVDIYLDCLGPKDKERDWNQALDQGATAIQTDHPAELVAFLRSKGLHK